MVGTYYLLPSKWLLPCNNRCDVLHLSASLQPHQCSRAWGCSRQECVSLLGGLSVCWGSLKMHTIKQTRMPQLLVSSFTWHQEVKWNWIIENKNVSFKKRLCSEPWVLCSALNISTWWLYCRGRILLLRRMQRPLELFSMPLLCLEDSVSCEPANDSLRNHSEFWEYCY